MNGNWVEIIRLRFVGDRFRNHALDAIALDELSGFQQLLTDTAKSLWHSTHPDRKRLPNQFEERTRLYIRSIEAGSTAVPLEAFIEEEESPMLFEKDEQLRDIKRAAELTYRVWKAAQTREKLPDEFPKKLINDFQQWGQTLSEDEGIELRMPGIVEETPVLVNYESREQLTMFEDKTHEDQVELVGEVIEADVHLGRFQLQTERKGNIKIGFSLEQEESVTSALKEHKTCRLFIKGTAEYEPNGDIRQVLKVNQMRLLLQHEEPLKFDNKAPWIGDVISEMAERMPEDERKKLPTDLARNIDHYIYGWPKR